MVKCDECGTELNNSGFCSKCGTQSKHFVKSKRRATTKSSLIALALIALVIFILVKLSSRSESTENLDLEKRSYFIAQTYVKDNLKAPSTAEFPNYNEKFVTVNSKGQYVIISYLDAQNSFGAMIRSKYRVILEYQSENWELIDILIE